MSRHLGDVSDVEWEQLMGAVVRWLKQTGVAGSIASDYSLYSALDDVRWRASKGRSSRPDLIVKKRPIDYFANK